MADTMSSSSTPSPEGAGPCRPRLVHESYTIAWICALSIETAAAMAMLDEMHEELPRISEHDNNCYKLGRIGRHNVVIATLPSGEYGTSSASSVSRNLLHTFPNIRHGLLVGIGGGVPSQNHDIRLGDVVVSSPADGNGGVFQYDFGKAIQGKGFQNTRFLNQPPSIMRAVTGALRADEELHGCHLDDIIEAALNRYPRLRKNYCRPDASSDRLYPSDVIHDESCCTDIGDASQQIIRAPRTGDESNPAIHYGLIASANQLIKDASIRDRLASEKDVLCFEMEAGGLMNELPCLVVRGISDYADTHKNDVWQRYAAISAASYARIFLQQLPAVKPISHSNTRTNQGFENMSTSHQALSGSLSRRASHQRLGGLIRHRPPPGIQKIFSTFKTRVLKIIFLR
ncbi:nucleoside phosphorylase domain-containing protein [Stachybotrys elegans]|uniref:Nucleoside phosphorylase domain-containing protein n=1 Tax=Stachybotrys elegans TaxID=80388 RepID=A0A8K0WR53_9HYPO|nr:nucleoside phosphorylase domain-containing protein [Stachybotrys elegans]